MEPPCASRFVPRLGKARARMAPALFRLPLLLQRPHISCRAKAALFVSSFSFVLFFTFLYIKIQAASLCVGSISLSFSSSPVKARRTPTLVLEFAEPLSVYAQTRPPSAFALT